MQLEAHFIFPLPKGAALSEFYLWMNGQKVKGELLEKEKATTIYEGIVRRLADPGLLEYLDTDVFRVRVFPVPARGEQRIELAFTQVLEQRGGVFRYHYPLGATGKGQPQEVQPRTRNDFTFTANLKTRAQLKSVYSPTHALGIHRKGEHEAVAGMEIPSGAELNRDLDLYFSTSDQAVGFSVLTFKEGSEPGYFLALVSPKAESAPGEVMAKRVTFVIDTSGSMRGQRMELAKQALSYCVTRLNAKDRFNVIRFGSDSESLFNGLVPASKENVDKASAFVSRMEAVGGTAIDEALRLALKDNTEPAAVDPHLVMFITDGQPTVGDTDENVISAHARDGRQKGTRLFTFGVGEDLNARLLDRLASEGQGSSEFLRDGREFEQKVSEFYDRVSSPVMTDLQLELSSLGAYDVYPKKMPDLFHGGQLVVMGRYRAAAEGKAVLKGTYQGQPKALEYAVKLPEGSTQEEFIPRLWAMRKVGFLLEEIRLRGEKPETRDEVITLAKKFGIVTPYTSYLVAEDLPVGDVRPRPFPADRPGLGMSGQGAGGGGHNRGGAFESFAAPPAGAAPKAAAPAPMMRAEALHDSVGSGAVAMSRETKRMKEAERPADGGGVRTAGGRTFLLQGGTWTQTKVSVDGKRLKVRFMGAAWSELLRRFPQLKGALALGDRVVLEVAPGKVVEVLPNVGEEKAEAVTAFLR
jgi:Ca-activated chloride channel family protein